MTLISNTHFTTFFIICIYWDTGSRLIWLVISIWRQHTFFWLAGLSDRYSFRPCLPAFHMVKLSHWLRTLSCRKSTRSFQIVSLWTEWPEKSKLVRLSLVQLRDSFYLVWGKKQLNLSSRLNTFKEAEGLGRSSPLNPFNSSWGFFVCFLEISLWKSHSDHLYLQFHTEAQRASITYWVKMSKLSRYESLLVTWAGS